MEGLHGQERRLLREEIVLPDQRGSKRAEWALALICVAAGVLFFTSLGELWPLADTPLTVEDDLLYERAGGLLKSLGFDVAGYRAASRLRVSTGALDYVEHAFGRERAQQAIRDGLPLIYERVLYKRRGETEYYAVRLHPGGGVLGWSKLIQPDAPGASIPVEQARALARSALTDALGLAPDDYVETSAATTEQTARRDHSFAFERTISEEPELRERIRLTVAGDEVVGGLRQLLVPDAAREEAIAHEAPGTALETFGFALVAIAGVAAFFLFLARVRDGTADLRRAAIWPTLVFVCLMTTFMLERASLFEYWQPLWPQWISDFRYFLFRAGEQAWLVLFLFAVVAAGDALDRRLGAGRGSTLAALGRGRLLDAGVARASGRGFLIGLLCGGTMALAVRSIGWLADGSIAIQPRGFFFYSLNSAAPALTSLLFFFGVALAEELGYRFFGGSWILSLTNRRWLAILIPGVMYGLTHTRMSFLPLADPFWARPLVLTLVGCVWGWAFLRYDALTVVLSHFTADLFIFNWPRLASGETVEIVVSLFTISVPLLPAFAYALTRLTPRRMERPQPG